ncbi:MAG: hypothetical protein HDR01_00250 [Lachnospiraceae bacterium]|nr:hypothetical protein [Lachnospiraceae bacterium]
MLGKRLWLCLAATLFLTGCGYENPDDYKTLDETVDESFLQQAVYDEPYEKPSSRPGVLVDRNGYGIESEKVALFRGEGLSQEFTVVNQETKQVVYKGKIQKKTYSEIDKEYISKGVFTELTEPGTYYIETSVIGQSYPFEIKEDVYGQIYSDILDSFYYHRCGTDLTGAVTVNNHQACHLGTTKLQGTDVVIASQGGWHTGSNFEKDVAEGAKIVSDLLMSYEYIEEKEGTEEEAEEKSRLRNKLLNEVVFEVNWLLSMQEEKSGGVYGGVYPEKETETTAPEMDQGTYYVEEISVEATAEFSAVMAQFSRIYGGYDEEFSAACLKASEAAYSYVEKYGELDDLQYYAAAELYKSTGNEKYHNKLKQYLGLNQPKENSRFSRKLYGDMAYLTCKQKVDVEICAMLMDELMDRAEELAATAKKDVYMVWTDELGRSARQILENTFVLAIIDRIITSHEYLGIMENQLHYLFGRNEDGVGMVTGKGILNRTDEGEEYQLYLQSSFIFILHEIIEREAEE